MDLVLGVIAFLIPVTVVIFIAWTEGALWHWIAYVVFTITVIAATLIWEIDYKYLVVGGVAFAIGALSASIRKR